MCIYANVYREGGREGRGGRTRRAALNFNITKSCNPSGGTSWSVNPGHPIYKNNDEITVA